MIDILQFNILLALQDTLVYCNVKKYLDIENPEKDLPADAVYENNTIKVTFS